MTKTKSIKKTAKNQTKKLKIPSSSSFKLSKSKLNKLLYPITLKEALDDYNRLKNIDCDKTNITGKSGSKFVNYFTSIERLNTKGRLGLSYFDVYYNFPKLYKEKKWITNAVNSVFKGKLFKDKENLPKNVKSFYTMYMGNVGLFKPMIAKHVLCKYNPSVVLDFTMGWGGRLTAACAMNLKEYIGIDLNTNLRPLYEKMKKTLNPLCDTKISLHFTDAANFDYSKLDYDFVLTSPPYYNIEIYNKNDVLSEEEWKEKFYIPAFTNTYKYLKKGGHYCLNVPDYIYNDICVKILGKCDEKISLSLPNHNRKYNEFIYVWNK